MEAVLNFMYHGEVNVAQDDLNSFLQVAEDLRVKGLTQNNAGNLQTEAQTNKYVPKPEAKPNMDNAQPIKFVSSPSTIKKSRPPPPPTLLVQPTDDMEQHVSVVKSEPRDHAHGLENNPIQPIVEEQNMDMQTNMMEHYGDHYEEEEQNMDMQTNMMEHYGDSFSKSNGSFEPCSVGKLKE